MEATFSKSMNRDKQALTGKKAVVTGAARGIGRAYALRLAALGADVAVVDVDLRPYEASPGGPESKAAETTVEGIRAFGRQSIGLEVDVSDAASMRQAVGSISREFGTIDIAVCNAGGGTGAQQEPRRENEARAWDAAGHVETRAAEVSDEVFDGVIRRNLYGTVNTCRPVAAVMKQQRSGRIVTVSSQDGRRASLDGGYAHYGTAKAGVQMYTRYLAQELGPYGITVNCIAPGFIGTERLMRIFEAQGIEQIVGSIALRRIGTPEECAGVLEFLVSDLGSYVTGAIIPVDGGCAEGRMAAG